MLHKFNLPVPMPVPKEISTLYKSILDTSVMKRKKKMTVL